MKLPDGRSLKIDGARRLVDPSDVPYLLDKENCKATLDLEKSPISPY
ncbi:MAG: hypothetical protein IPK01_11375 [Acidobacteria bacterium]|nr:hypothetical protein [Acidobacteriota bacterium]